MMDLSWTIAFLGLCLVGIVPQAVANYTYTKWRISEWRKKRSSKCG